VIAGVTAWVVADADDEPVGTASGEPLPAADVPRAGEPAPDFDLRTLAGGRLELASLRGRPVVVNFWASYCHPCRKEFPLLRTALREHRDDRLAIVGVDSQDIASDARAFAREQHATWPMPIDEQGDVTRAYGVRGLPFTFFVDGEGTIRARVIGELSEQELTSHLRKIIPPSGTSG